MVSPAPIWIRYKDMISPYKGAMTWIQAHHASTTIFIDDAIPGLNTNLMDSLMLAQYSERFCRYKHDEMVNYMKGLILKHYPNLYKVQIMFKNDEINKLVDQNLRGSQVTNKQTGQDITKDLVDRAIASTNTGINGQTNIIFDPTTDSILNKTFNKSDNTTTVTYGKIYESTIINLYNNILNIINTKLNYGMSEFVSKFNHLFVQWEGGNDG